MENHDQAAGDLLEDIIRASNGGGISSSSNENINKISDWKFSSSVDELIKFPSVGIIGEQIQIDNFGDPFSTIPDPILHHDQLSVLPSGSSNSTFFDTSSISNPKNSKPVIVHENESSHVSCSNLLAQRILDAEMKNKNNSNIFSRMLQISPNSKMSLPASPCDLPSPVSLASPKGTSSPPNSIVINDMIKGINPSTCCSIDNNSVQISSPRNPGIKRRKTQAKKVVCIPAPAAANSRPSGEVVPSDLWAWRKYGQKPIKGSPYPRGYYRCSSSKGCSARKQVERSRTDPNMLVITYTSEHNHPWPTQRNALAGSTRSQPTKNMVQKLTNFKEEHKENTNKDNSSSVIMPSGSVVSSSIKEEIGETTEKSIDMSDGDFGHGFDHHETSYQSLPDMELSNHPYDFFAGLGELEADPLNLLFSQGFNEGKSDGKREQKGLDPFSLFDWTGNNSFDEESARRGL